MHNVLKLGVFTIFTAFIFGFICCGESSATPGQIGYDENGVEQNVHNVKKYLKANPYKAPAPKPKPKPASKPAPKKVANKPKPVPKKDVVVVSRVELREMVAIEVQAHKDEAKKISFGKVLKSMGRQAEIGATGFIAGGAGAIPGIGLGALGGSLSGLASALSDE